MAMAADNGRGPGKADWPTVSVRCINLHTFKLVEYGATMETS